MPNIPFKNKIELHALDFIEQWYEDWPAKVPFPTISPIEAHLSAMQLSTAVSMKRIADTLEELLILQQGPTRGVEPGVGHMEALREAAELVEDERKANNEPEA